LQTVKKGTCLYHKSHNTNPKSINITWRQ